MLVTWAHKTRFLNVSEHLNKRQDFSDMARFCQILGGGGVGRDDQYSFTHLCEAKSKDKPACVVILSLKAVEFPPFSFQLPFPLQLSKQRGLRLPPGLAPSPSCCFPDISHGNSCSCTDRLPQTFLAVPLAADTEQLSILLPGITPLWGALRPASHHVSPCSSPAPKTHNTCLAFLPCNWPLTTK